ncbi:MAG: hypothetical protein CME61_09375 [Halobacteriovoraceae bacterium]|nr:hypothetical protein [Halobacteriovoraceae bacterium]
MQGACEPPGFGLSGKAGQDARRMGADVGSDAKMVDYGGEKAVHHVFDLLRVSAVQGFRRQQQCIGLAVGKAFSHPREFVSGLLAGVFGFAEQNQLSPEVVVAECAGILHLSPRELHPFSGKGILDRGGAGLVITDMQNKRFRGHKNSEGWNVDYERFCQIEPPRMWRQTLSPAAEGVPERLWLCRRRQ